MVKVTITNDSTIYDDDTVRQTCKWECETAEEFEKIWEDRRIIKACTTTRDITWHADVDDLTITATEYVHYTQVLYPKEQWVLSEDETRMLKLGQIEGWMTVNPQLQDREEWDAIEMTYEHIKKAQTWEDFDKLLQAFTLLTRTMNPACFFRGDENESL